MSFIKKLFESIYKGEAIHSSVDRAKALKANWKLIRSLVALDPKSPSRNTGGVISPPILFSIHERREADKTKKE